MQTKDISDAEVVQACRDAYKVLHAGGLDLLVDRFNCHPKICIRAMERAQERGLIEVGVSLRCAWPTPKGLELLGEKK